MATAKKGGTSSNVPAAPANKHAVAKKPDNPFALASTEGVDTSVVEADAAKGHDFTQDELAIPFLRVLQKGSPEVNKRDDKYIEGAEAGMFIDTATREIFDGENEGIYVVPVHHEKSFIRWKPRKAGGGLVRDYGTDASVVDQTTENEDRKREFDNGDELVESNKYFVFLVDRETGEAREMVFVLAGMQRKKARKWNTKMSTIMVPRASGVGEFNPAKYYVVYNIKTVYEENDKGDWMGITEPEPVMATINLPYGAGLYMKARHFAEQIDAGQVKVQPPVNESVVEAEVTEGDDDI